MEGWKSLSPFLCPLFLCFFIQRFTACLVINQTGRFSTGWGDEFFISRPYQIIKSSALSFSVFSFTGRGGTRFMGS